MKTVRQLIEEAMAEVDNTTPEKHKNLLGNKNRYIEAIARKLGKCKSFAEFDAAIRAERKRMAEEGTPKNVTKIYPRDMEPIDGI